MVSICSISPTTSNFTPGFRFGEPDRPHGLPRAPLGSIPLCLQVRGKSREGRLDAVAFHIFDAHAIDAGASSVGSHFLPGPPQHVGPDDAVIPRMEPTAPIPLGRKVQSALEVS